MWFKQFWFLVRVLHKISILHVIQTPTEILKKLTLLKHYFLISQQEQLGNVSSNFNLSAWIHIVHFLMSTSTRWYFKTDFLMLIYLFPYLKDYSFLTVNSSWQWMVLFLIHCKIMYCCEVIYNKQYLGTNDDADQFWQLKMHY